MSVIEITETAEVDEGWEFKVRVDGHTYRVKLSEGYYRQLTGGEVAPECLIEESFKFLLEREPASSIMREFDLPVIGRYFPEYEEEIAGLASASE